MDDSYYSGLDNSMNSGYYDSRNYSRSKRSRQYSKSRSPYRQRKNFSKFKNRKTPSKSRSPFKYSNPNQEISINIRTIKDSYYVVNSIIEQEVHPVNKLQQDINDLEERKLITISKRVIENSQNYMLDTFEPKEGFNYKKALYDFEFEQLYHNIKDAIKNKNYSNEVHYIDKQFINQYNYSINGLFLSIDIENIINIRENDLVIITDKNYHHYFFGSVSSVNHNLIKVKIYIENEENITRLLNCIRKEKMHIINVNIDYSAKIKILNNLKDFEYFPFKDILNSNDLSKIESNYSLQYKFSNIVSYNDFESIKKIVSYKISLIKQKSFEDTLHLTALITKTMIDTFEQKVLIISKELDKKRVNQYLSLFNEYSRNVLILDNNNNDSFGQLLDYSNYTEENEYNYIDPIEEDKKISNFIYDSALIKPEYEWSEEDIYRIIQKHQKVIETLYEQFIKKIGLRNYFPTQKEKELQMLYVFKVWVNLLNVEEILPFFISDYAIEQIKLTDFKVLSEDIDKYLPKNSVYPYNADNFFFLTPKEFDYIITTYNLWSIGNPARTYLLDYMFLSSTENLINSYAKLSSQEYTKKVNSNRIILSSFDNVMKYYDYINFSNFSAIIVIDAEQLPESYLVPLLNDNLKHLILFGDNNPLDFYKNEIGKKEKYHTSLYNRLLTVKGSNRFFIDRNVPFIKKENDEICGAILRCEHRCTNKKQLCLKGTLHKPCKEKCNRVLLCGHRCINLCCEECNCQYNCIEVRNYFGSPFILIKEANSPDNYLTKLNNHCDKMTQKEMKTFNQFVIEHYSQFLLIDESIDNNTNNFSIIKGFSQEQIENCDASINDVYCLLLLVNRYIVIDEYYKDNKNKVDTDFKENFSKIENIFIIQSGPSMNFYQHLVIKPFTEQFFDELNRKVNNLHRYVEIQKKKSVNSCSEIDYIEEDDIIDSYFASDIINKKYESENAEKVIIKQYSAKELRHTSTNKYFFTTKTNENVFIN